MKMHTYVTCLIVLNFFNISWCMTLTVISIRKLCILIFRCRDFHKCSDSYYTV